MSEPRTSSTPASQADITTAANVIRDCADSMRRFERDTGRFTELMKHADEATLERALQQAGNTPERRRAIESLCARYVRLADQLEAERQRAA